MGRLLGGGARFNSPEWSGAPRLLKRSLPRLYYCCCWLGHRIMCVCVRADSYLLIEKTCRLRDVGLYFPRIILHPSCNDQERNPHLADQNASSCYQEDHQHCAPHSATSSTRVAEIEPLIYATRCARGFLFSRIRFLPGPEPLTEATLHQLQQHPPHCHQQ